MASTVGRGGGDGGRGGRPRGAGPLAVPPFTLRTPPHVGLRGWRPDELVSDTGEPSGPATLLSSARTKNWDPQSNYILA